jgi:aryl sulfotransferase
MSHGETVQPRKTREIQNHHMDSRIWNDFAFRDDDIVIATYAKAGTTWTQQIVGQLVFRGDDSVEMGELSPWVDLRVPAAAEKLAMLEAQEHRRVVKTHLPLDALTFSPKAKYLYIGRDGRDVLFSFHHHHSIGNALWYELLNDTPGRVGPPLRPPDPDVQRYFQTWLERDGYPIWSFWENVASWWAARDLPNVKLIHFNELKADLSGSIESIAAFLDIAVEPPLLNTIVEHCSFDYMKKHATRVAPLGGAVFDGGAGGFFNRGVNGRWHDVLSADDVAAFERTALERLGPACAKWIATGEMT